MSAEASTHSTGQTQMTTSLKGRARAPRQDTARRRVSPLRRAGTLLVAAGMLLLAPGVAHADYEQVGNFANESKEAAQFGGIPSGGAVNVTGAGGVEPGSVYFSIGSFGNRIVRYSPASQFREAWGWGVTSKEGPLNAQYERCGPAIGTECYSDGGPGANPTGEPGEAATSYCGAATDLAGDLYVLDREGAGRVYGPGGGLLTEFKFSGLELETCGLAVDASGAIYTVGRSTNRSLETASVQKLEPVGAEYPPTAATRYVTGSTIYGSRGVLAAAPDEGIGSLAIDPANQHLYVTEAAGDEMQEFKKPAEPFRLECRGHETATLPANAVAVEIKAALEAVPVSCGTVHVSEEGVINPGHDLRVTFEGVLADDPVSRLRVIKAEGNEEATELASGSSVSHISVYETNGTRLNTIDPGISGASYYGIGVDGSTGDIYVADKAHAKAYVLGSSGALKTEITGSGCEKGAFTEMEAPALAVDQSNGNVLISDVKGHGVVDEFDSSGNCILSVNRPFVEAGPTAIAINDSGGLNNGIAYVTSKNGTVSSVYAYAPPLGFARVELPALSHEAPGGMQTPTSIAVDQQTGDVYVANQIEGHMRQHDLIEVYNADGTELIAHFGDAGSESETFAASPEKIHSTGFVRGIAVNESGTVYLADATSGGNRVMCFHPESSGDYRHYVYCGRSRDVEVNSTRHIEDLGLDDAGNLYVGNEESFREFSLARPSTPICTYLTNSQATAMTVNQVTGEVLYFVGSTDRRVHRLTACDPATGKFKEAQTPGTTEPSTRHIYAMALNPDRAWDAERPRGILYAADGERHEIEGVEHYGIGDIFAPAIVHPPTVESEEATKTRTSSTILSATINPHGYGTHYFFQYVSEAEYQANTPSERFAGAREVPIGGGELAGNTEGQASAAVSGLTPGGVYRFRVIASSMCDVESEEPCIVEGEAASFSTYPLLPSGLPDHRAYELVSPAQKQGGQVIPADSAVSSCIETGRGCKYLGKPGTLGNILPMQSTSDGEALVYEGFPFSQTEGPVLFTSYLARRTVTGWSTTELDPALQKEGDSSGHVAFDASLGNGLLYEASRIGTGSPTEDNLYVQDTAEPQTLAPLVTEMPPDRGESLQIVYGGRSADLSQIFFAANGALTKATPVAPEPSDPGASKNDLYEWREGRFALVNALPGNSTVAAGASFASISPDANGVSVDGRRVYWKDETGRLYVREDANVTREVRHPGQFLSASPDGSQALLSDGCLYALTTETCTDLTEGKGGFQGLVGHSTDLSHIYFVDTEVLGGGKASATGEIAEAGKENLYSWSAGTNTFIAQLGNETQEGKDWAANPAERTAEASPDGRFLAFASQMSLTGYDNVGLCGRGEVNLETGLYPLAAAPCNEAFLYDSTTGRLTCASCDPTGAAPVGSTTLRRLEGFPERFPQPHYLTDEGRLYFDSQDALVARDTNGVEDVYEYEPKGAGGEGTCEAEAGCVFLISAGSEPFDSNLVAVDETGKNVFFDTRDQLTLKDKDDLLDIYDAREGGGIPAETETGRGECQGESCQAPVSPPNYRTPASQVFDGAGNTTVPKPQTGNTIKQKSTKHKKKQPTKHKKQPKKRKKQPKINRRHARKASRRPHRRAGGQDVRAAKTREGGAK